MAAFQMCSFFWPTLYFYYKLGLFGTFQSLPRENPEDISFSISYLVAVSPSNAKEKSLL